MSDSTGPGPANSVGGDDGIPSFRVTHFPRVSAVADTPSLPGMDLIVGIPLAIGRDF